MGVDAALGCGGRVWSVEANDGNSLTWLKGVAGSSQAYPNPSNQLEYPGLEVDPTGRLAFRVS